jgi:hypothetical protein
VELVDGVVKEVREVLGAEAEANHLLLAVQGRQVKEIAAQTQVEQAEEEAALVRQVPLTSVAQV